MNRFGIGQNIDEGKYSTNSNSLSQRANKRKKDKQNRLFAFHWGQDFYQLL